MFLRRNQAEDLRFSLARRSDNPTPREWFSTGAGWGFFGERIAVKGGLCLWRVFGEAVQEEVVGLFALAAGGFKPAAQDAVVLQTLAGTRNWGARLFSKGGSLRLCQRWQPEQQRSQSDNR